MNFREIEAVRPRRRVPGLDGYDYASAVDDALGPEAGLPAPGLAADAYAAGRDAARAELGGAPEMEFSPDEAESDPAYQAGLSVTGPTPAPGLASANEVFASPPPASAPIAPPGAPSAPAPSPPLASTGPQASGGTAQADSSTQRLNSQATANAPIPPSPVTPAPSSNEENLASAADVFGSQPEGAMGLSAPGLAIPGAGGPGMAKDSRASDKMLGRNVPGLDGYAMTQDERAALTEARQGDRRMRIAQGVLGGVGGLLAAIGAGTGNGALAGVGMGTRMVGGVIPAGRRAQEVLDDYRRRTEGVQAQTAADQRAQQLGIEGDRVGVQRIGEEANMVRAQGQAQLDAANAANAEFERASAEGNAAGMRAAIRARIAAMPDDERKRTLAQQYAQGTDLDREADLNSLRSILDSVEAIDSPGMQIERSRGRGGGGGASGPMSIDPATGQIIQQAQPGGGSRGPTGPTFSDPFATPGAPTQAPGAEAQYDDVAAMPPQSAARPSRPSARRGRGEAAAAPRPAPTAEQAAADDALAIRVAGEAGVQLNTDIRQRIQDIADTLRDEGTDPASPGGARELRTILAGLQSEGGVRTHAESELLRRQTAANAAAASGQAIGASPAAMRHITAQITPVLTGYRTINSTLSRLQSFADDHPAEFAAAVAGHPLPNGASREVYSEIREFYQNRKHEITGAAASDREMQEIMGSLGLTSVDAIFAPETVLSVMRRLRDGYLDRIQERGLAGDVRSNYRYLLNTLGGNNERRRAQVSRMLRGMLRYTGAD